MSKRIECPWPHVGPGSHPNVPTPEGRELGLGLAHFAAQEFEKDPSLPAMCVDCAFRAGSDPNGSGPTLMSALKSIFERTPFFCHHAGEDGEERLCAGFVALLRASPKDGEGS